MAKNKQEPEVSKWLGEMAREMDEFHRLANVLGSRKRASVALKRAKASQKPHRRRK